jgi:propanediol dehydratase small subunit
MNRFAMSITALILRTRADVAKACGRRRRDLASVKAAELSTQGIMGLGSDAEMWKNCSEW